MRSLTNNFKIYFLILSSLFILVIDVVAQSWQALNSTPFRTHHSNGIGHNDKAYVIQGTHEENEPNNLWEYNSDNDLWTIIGAFPGEARELAIGDDWEGKYYFGAGFGESNGPLSDLWVFDPVDQSFTELPSCPCPGRGHPALIAQNDKVLLGAGSGDGGDLDDWWEFDLNTETWTQKEDIPGGNRHHPFFFGFENKAYIGGGHIDNWMEWNMDTDTWTEIDNLPGGRVAGTQIDYDGLGIILAGDEIDHGNLPINQTFMVFDPQTGEWDYMPALPDGSRWAPSSFILNDELYFFGGYGYNGANDSLMWKFDFALFDCLPPSDLNVLNLEESSADLFWQTNSSAISDTLKWRKEGNPNWNIIANPQAVFQLTDLEVCQNYEFKVISECASLGSSSEIFTFRTKGCGICLDIDYCDIPVGLAGNTEFIQEVQINNYINTSGNNNGFGNFITTGLEPIVIGETFELRLTPGLPDNNSFPLNFTVWIDFNADGEFEFNEIVVSENGVENQITESILVPTSASTGIIRMRILYGFNSPASACDNGLFEFGELEDYCLNLENLSSVYTQVDDREFAIHPNPIQHSFSIAGNFSIDQKHDLTILDIVGKTVLTIEDFEINKAIDLSSFSSGVYFIKINSGSKHISTLRAVKQ